MAVECILDLVRERRGETELGGRLPEDVADALCSTGIHRLGMPTVLGGGLQAPVVDVVDVVERLAAVDGNTARCAAIGVASNVFAGYIPESAAREVFADPDRGSASIFAPCGEVDIDRDPPRLTGRWPFVSNCLHSTWIGVGASLPPEDEDDPEAEPVTRLVFVPASAVTIEDTWDALGLQGTGSHHISIQDLPIDLGHSCAFSDAAWPEGTLWRLPLFTVLPPMLAAVALGVARGAMDEIARQAREGRPAVKRTDIGEDPIAMAELAVADTKLRAASAGLRAALEAAWRRAERGEEVDRPLEAQVALAGLHACDAGFEVTAVAHQLGGGSAVYADSILQRALRDVATLRQHAAFGHMHLPELGRALAGLDIYYRPYIV